MAEVVISFDTTGSMFPCLTQVRRVVQDLTRDLFREVPGLRVGVIAHGDYCDGARVISKFELSDDQAAICRFIQRVEPTGGGDAPEAYELVLHEARSFAWTRGQPKALVLIGDDVPHGPDYRENRLRLDWRNELRSLLDLEVQVHGVQALNRRYATRFYQEIARITGGFHLTLDQFSNVTDILMAICFQQAGPERLQQFEEELVRTRRMNRNLDRVVSTLAGRTASAGSTARFASEADLRPVPPGRFQILSVDRDTPIKTFCEEQGLTFKQGRGFYELTKTVTVQGTKEIILRSRASGDLFTGTRARELLGLPLHDEDVKLRPTHLEEFEVFIQSTSNNRKLIGSTQFLYEVSDWDRSEEGPPTAWDRIAAAE